MSQDLRPDAAGPVSARLARVDTPPARRRSRLLPLFAGFLLLALAVSVAGNWLLYRQATTYYRELSQTQLDPYGTAHTSFRADMPSGPPDGSTTVVMLLGDSRAHDWPPPPMPGYRWVNRGVGGQTTAQILGRFDAHVAPAEPHVVVLQAGINDLKAIPLFPNRRAEIVADCKVHLREIVRRSVDGGAFVVVTTIFPAAEPTWDRRPVWSPDIDAAVVEVNADLKKLARDEVQVLDAWSLLETGGRMRPAYALDTLHLDTEGYRSLNIPLEQMLRSFPGGKTTR